VRTNVWRWASVGAWPHSPSACAGTPRREIDRCHDGACWPEVAGGLTDALRPLAFHWRSSRRLLNGGPKYWGSDHNTNMSKASDTEATRLNAADATRKSEAQQEADALYDENIRRDQEAKEAAKGKGGGAWGGLGGVFGGIVGGQEDNKRKQTEEEIRKSGGKGEGFSLSHIIPFASKDEHATKKPKTEAAAASSWNPFAAKPASPPPTPASWNPFAKGPAPPPPKESALSALNPFARKPEKEKSWHEKISADMKNKSNEIKASVLDAHVK
jgi:hypothetical protein